MARVLTRPRPGVEMSGNAAVASRVSRLVLVSSVALGVITWLAYDTTDGARGTVLLLGASWITMPMLLQASLSQPRLRYLLVVPAGCASVGLLATALSVDGPMTATMGWWLTTVGVWMGGAMGAWFWFRMAPVPPALDQPFSPARWRLIALHVALVSTGVLSVIGSRLF